MRRQERASEADQDDYIFTYTNHSAQFAIMVAGKDTSRALAKVASAPKLPPLPKLRVRRPDQTNENPCLGVMSSVLGMCNFGLGA